jgi:hypothetical protein
MGFCANYRQRRLELTGRESAETLDYMGDYLQDGANWTQGMYENANGARCLVGAANHVRVSSNDDAKHWLRLAIAEVAPDVARIEDFNDTRRSYAEVKTVIARAKQLAAQSAARLALPPPARASLPAPVAEFLPPQRHAPPLSVAPAVYFNPPPRRRSARRSLADWIMD